MEASNQISSVATPASPLGAVQKLFEAFGKSDIAFILDHVTADCRWTAPGEGMIPVAGEYIGPNGVARFFEILSETQKITLFEPYEFFEKGDAVVVLGVEEMTSVKTGHSVRTHWVMVFRFRDGKVYQWDQFFDTAAYAHAQGESK